MLVAPILSALFLSNAAMAQGAPPAALDPAPTSPPPKTTEPKTAEPTTIAPTADTAVPGVSSTAPSAGTAPPTGNEPPFEEPSGPLPPPAPGAPAFVPLPPPEEEKKDDVKTGAEALEATPRFGTDTRSGHFYAAAGFSFVAPFGEVASGINHYSRTSVGFAPSLELSYGVSRSVSIGAYGSYALFGGGRLCPECSSSSLGAGAFVRYHLVTGLRFDPWVSFGVGFRSLSTTMKNDDVLAYSGLEAARVQIGGDWSLHPLFALGPFLFLGAGTFFGAPPKSENRDDTIPAVAAGSGGVHWRFEAGLRASFDFPGK